jgi:hypothetical protein
MSSTTAATMVDGSGNHYSPCVDVDHDRHNVMRGDSGDDDSDPAMEVAAPES